MLGNLRREIPGVPGYFATRDGTIYGLKGAPLAKIKKSNGYLVFGFNQDGGRREMSIHKAVLLAWIGPCPPGLQCLHWDDDKSNNRLANLRWGTPKENAEDRDRNGNTARRPGELSPTAKLTDDSVIAILGELRTGRSQSSIAVEYDVCQQTVSGIASGKRWRHIPRPGA